MMMMMMMSRALSLCLLSHTHTHTHTHTHRHRDTDDSHLLDWASSSVCSVLNLTHLNLILCTEQTTVQKSSLLSPQSFKTCLHSNE